MNQECLFVRRDSLVQFTEIVLSIAEIMQTDVFTLGRNDKLSIADDLMTQKRIRHIVVLDEFDKVCGVVSQRDLYRGALFKALGYGSHLAQKMLDNYVVKEAMSNELITTTKDTLLSEAASIMLTNKIGCMPVLDGEKLVGLITETDFLRLAAAG